MPRFKSQILGQDTRAIAQQWDRFSVVDNDGRLAIQLRNYLFWGINNETYGSLLPLNCRDWPAHEKSA